MTWDKFFQLKQEGRSLDQFMMLIRKQANDCEFGEMKENLMLHVLIRGVDKDRMRCRLLETAFGKGHSDVPGDGNHFG